MTPISSRPLGVCFEWGTVIFWILVGLFEFRWKQKAPRFLRALLWLPGKYVRIALIILTFGLLAACSNADPLAVASGAVFPLNTGHWQPGPHDLAEPPVITNQ